MISVVATIQTAEGRRDDVLKEFEKVVPTVRKEAGCLLYVPSVDIETPLEAQPPARENVVTVVEQWESIDALQAHLATPHMAEFLAAIGDMVADLTIRVLQPATA